MTEDILSDRACFTDEILKYYKNHNQSVYPWYPGDDADVKFKDATIKSSLLDFWQTSNFAKPPSNKKVTSRINTAVYFGL